MRTSPVHSASTTGDGEANLAGPLLPELRSSTSDVFVGASVSGAVFNLSTCIIGAAIMSIPAAMRILGVIPAILLIATVGFLAASSAELLLRHTSSPCSYSATMEAAFGRPGAIVLHACICLSMTSALIVYLIIIGDVFSGSQSDGAVHLGVLQEWFGVHWWNGRSVALLITVGFAILPLVLFKRVDSLRYTSAISILLAVVFVFISSSMAIYALVQGRTETPRMLPDFSHLSNFELFTIFPVIAVAFNFHFNVHPIRSELNKSSDMVMVIRISIILCSVIYAAVGFTGYLLFGESTMVDILSNFDKNTGSVLGSVLNDVIRLSYALRLMLVFPLLFFPLRINIHELLFPESNLLVNDNFRFRLLTCFLLGCIYLAAVAIPNIWTIFQVFGSTTTVSIFLIFPGAIVLRDVLGISKRRDKILATIMIALALMTSFITISFKIFSSIRGTK